MTNHPPTDTGTTLLLLPDNVVSDYYGQVSGAQQDSSAGGYTVPCSATLPDFTVTIGGYDAVVPGSLINYAPLQAGSTTCFGGIQSNSGLGFSIFGDIFLKSQYVVFDSNGPRLGFAPQA
jgi:aspergillopepsin I